MPRSVVHLLLSLLLLFTQQMSLLHVTSHIGKARAADAVQAVEHGQSDHQGKRTLLDFCAKCLDGAQLAFSMPVPAYVFALLNLAYGHLAVRRGDGIAPRTVRLFQPRGPPPAR